MTTTSEVSIAGPVGIVILGGDLSRLCCGLDSDGELNALYDSPGKTNTSHGENMRQVKATCDRWEMPTASEGSIGRPDGDCHSRGRS